LKLSQEVLQNIYVEEEIWMIQISIELTSTTITTKYFYQIKLFGNKICDQILSTSKSAKMQIKDVTEKK
jgi:hypothetical protein